MLTNAVQHAEGPLVLHLRRTVTELADGWGVRPNDQGKTTWFTLRL